MKVSNTQLINSIQQSQQKVGLPPSSQSWVEAITESLNTEKVSTSNRYTEPSIVVDISQKAIDSKYWNDENISFPISNKDVQSYTRDLTLVSKNQY
ncbi:MAG: hypothetical protein U9R37_03700 [Campylobacterota bacterium]|nr:hypothetical protein [Campylobacterota bacterium]